MTLEEAEGQMAALLWHSLWIAGLWDFCTQHSFYDPGGLRQLQAGGTNATLGRRRSGTMQGKKQDIGPVTLGVSTSLY